MGGREVAQRAPRHVELLPERRHARVVQERPDAGVQLHGAVEHAEEREVRHGRVRRPVAETPPGGPSRGYGSDGRGPVGNCQGDAAVEQPKDVGPAEKDHVEAADDEAEVAEGVDRLRHGLEGADRLTVLRGAKRLSN